MFSVQSAWTQNQESTKGRITLGLGYGAGTQQMFPFNSSNYDYRFTSYKLRLSYCFKETNKWNFELAFEPGVYIVNHQLLNASFVQPKHGLDYLEQREEFSEDKRYNEYVLDLGIIVRHQTFKNLSFYLQGGVGPMISERRTERLAKGFAFSDIIAIGFSYRINAIQLDVQTGIRHVSNARLQARNVGHNAVLAQIGISYILENR